MIIFIRNIPEDTLRQEIIAFLKPALKGGLFSVDGEIRNIKYLKITDKNTSLAEYHALVQVEPDAAALRVIKKLHGKKFRGRHTVVRQYHVRRWQNDKRLSSSKEVSPELKERRTNPTRRRNTEITEVNTMEFRGYREFNRKL
jgi:hypothetical protein